MTLSWKHLLQPRSYKLLTLACVLVWLCEEARPELIKVLACGRPTLPQEPWTPLTAMFTHGFQPQHIFLNMLSLWFAGKAIEERYPWWWFFSTYMVGGLLANLAWVLWGPEAVVVGASGAIFTVLGMAVPLTRFHWSTLLIVVFNFALGFITPNVAWLVHIVGFLVGLLMGCGFALYIREHNRRAVALSSES